jgi:hypothetical protein
MSNKLNLVRQRLAQSMLVGFQTSASSAPVLVAPAKSASAKLSVSKTGSPKLGNSGGVVKTGSPKLGGVVKTL